MHIFFQICLSNTRAAHAVSDWMLFISSPDFELFSESSREPNLGGFC